MTIILLVFQQLPSRSQPSKLPTALWRILSLALLLKQWAGQKPFRLADLAGECHGRVVVIFTEMSQAEPPRVAETSESQLPL
jgi:hypothetical protein